MKVYLAEHQRGNKRRIHTNRDCTHLQQSDGIQAKDLEIVEGHFPECRFCNETLRKSNNGDTRKTRQKLLELEPEDIGLSPRGEIA